MSFMKGLGVGFIIAGLSNYFGLIPGIGPFLAGYSTYIFLVLGVICLFLGFKQ